MKNKLFVEVHMPGLPTAYRCEKHIGALLNHCVDKRINLTEVRFEERTEHIMCPLCECIEMN